MTTNLCRAQVINDSTLSTDVDTADGRNFNIIGGREAGDNLFHSFSQFSVPTGGSAIFDNAPNIQNIFSRVTGGSISNIDGSIKANGNSNLFLLNPNGIIFGSNAQLDIGGSFIATTADRLVFTDNTFFSATDLQTPPLLTISIPIGIQFGRTANPILNRSDLEVQREQTLALVGGNISINNGGLFAPDGRVELGSVADNSFVSLIPTTEGWTFQYESVQNFRDIQLSQNALVDTTGESSGDISLQGRQIAISQGSAITSFNFFGTDPGGSIIIKASESLEISESSRVNSNAFATGKSGDIEIETKQLIVRDRSFIDTANQGNGQGGSLTINAAESVEINGGGGLSRVSTQTLGDREAGDLKITTQRLLLRDGGQINSSTRESGGDGGSLIVNAENSVEVRGQGIVETGEMVSSGLFAETRGETTFGDGGNLNINTGNLSIRDGGTISVAATRGSTGRAGNLNIDANSLFLDRGTITAETSQTGGEAGANINLEIADLLKLENESLISATASDEADGGNIDISANFVVAVPNQNSDIIARAEQGTGGKIDIFTNGIFGITERSSTPRNNTNDIDPSSEFGLDGTVDINELEVNPTEGLAELPTEVIDVARLVAQNLCQQGRGSEFIVAGKGGIASSPMQARDGEISEIDLVEPANSEDDARRNDRPIAHTKAAPEIVEAQGWIINDRGILELVAHRTDPGNFSPQLPAKQLCP